VVVVKCVFVLDTDEGGWGGGGERHNSLLGCSSLKGECEASDSDVLQVSTT
jgi:hypothetical protein